jgi:predicted O-methyltransferase YrrM
VLLFRDNLLDLVFAPYSIYVLFTANRLRIFTLLAEKEMTVDEIAASTGARIRPLEGLLDACAALGLLRRQKDRYKNSHMSDAYLVEGRPLYLGGLIEVQAIEAGNWQRLYDLVMGGQRGGDQGAEKEVTPELFTEAMNNLGMLGEAEALATAVDLRGCKKMIDVGCGSGLYSITLCRHYPDLQAILVDKKEVLAVTQRFINESSLQNRIRVRSADILKDSFGKDEDVVLLSDVLYQDSSTCIQILQSAYDALAPGGLMIIRGYFTDPKNSQPVFGSLFAIGRLLFDEDREIISIPLLEGWIEKVGFKITSSHSLTERSTLIQARK